MAQRQQQKRLTNRAVIDPQLSFDYTTPNLEVHARPVDPMVYGGSTSELDGYRRLTDALGIAQGTVQTGMQAYQQFNTEQSQKGQTDALTGQEKPSKGIARIRGWEHMNGALVAKGEYQQQVQTFVNNNIHSASPEEFEQGIQEISNNFMKGTSDFWLQGYAPLASEIEQEAFDSYVKAQEERVYNDTISYINTKAFDDTQTLVQNVMASSFGLSSLEELNSKPYVYQILNNGDYGNMFAPVLRQSLSEAQEIGLDMGISRAEVSKIYVNAIGELAVEYGLPELLDFVYEPDETGNPLVRRPEGEQGATYQKKAKGVQQSYTKQYEQTLTKQQIADKERKQSIFRNTSSLQLTSLENLAGTDPEAASKLASSLFETLLEDERFWELSESDFDDFIETLIKYESINTSFLPKSNPDAVAMLVELQAQESLTLDDLNQVKKQLSLEDWLNFRRDIASSEQKVKSTLQEEVETTEKERLEQSHQDIRASVESVLAYGSPAESLELLATLEMMDDFRQMEGTEYSTTYRRLLERSLVDTTFAEKSNQQVLKSFVIDRNDDSLSLEAINEVSHLLTYQDYEKLVGDYFEQERKLEKIRLDAQTLANEVTEKALKDSKELRINQFERTYDTIISELDLMSPKERIQNAREQRQAFLNDYTSAELTPATYKRILDELTEHSLGDGQFADGDGDPALFSQYRTLLVNGLFTRDDLWEVFDNAVLNEKQWLILSEMLDDQNIEDNNELQRAIEDFQRRTEERRVENERLAEEAEEQARIDAKDDSLKTSSTYLLEILSNPNPTERNRLAEQMIRQIEADNKTHDYSLSEYNTLMNQAYQIKNDSLGFDVSGGNLGVYSNLLLKASNGALSNNELFNSARYLTEGQFDKLNAELKNSEEKAFEWTDKELIMSLQTSVIRAIVGSTDWGVTPSERLDLETTVRLDLGNALINFRNNNNGRSPSWEEYQEMLDPILVKNRVSWKDIFSNHGKPVAETKVDTPSGTSKKISEVNPEEEFIYQPPKGFWEGLFSKDTETINPSWGLGREESFGLIQQGLQSLSIADIKQAWTEIGMDDGAIKYYAGVYAADYARLWYLEHGYTNQSVKQFMDYMRDKGYTDDEITEASSEGLRYLEETNQL